MHVATMNPMCSIFHDASLREYESLNTFSTSAKFFEKIAQQCSSTPLACVSISFRFLPFSLRVLSVVCFVCIYICSDNLSSLLISTTNVASITLTSPFPNTFLSLFSLSSSDFFQNSDTLLGSLLATAYWITLINSSKWPLKLHQNKHRRNKNARQTDITFN